MNFRAIRAIVRKDIKVVIQSRGVVVPILIVPLIMLVLMPLGVIVGIIVAPPSEVARELGSFLANMPASLQSELLGFNETQRIVVLTVMYMLAPMYLIVPLMVASVIAADSIAGEKERKTLEALLYTPTTDRELILAKMLSAWVPALVVGLASFVLYGIVVNAAAWPVMGRVFFPNAMWLLLVLWVGPAAAALGLGTTVLVSARVSTFQEAYQMGGLVVLPVLVLVLGQATGLMYLSAGLVALLGLVLWAFDAAVLWLGSRTIKRSEIIARL